MTMSIRHFNVAIAALFAAFALHAMPAFASDNLEHSGKLQIESGRIGESSGDQQEVETAQEKIAPDLFKKQTVETVKAKQQAEAKIGKQLKKTLFTEKTGTKQTTAAKVALSLFSKDYKTDAADRPEIKNKQEGGHVGIFAGSLFGAVCLVAGGAYAVLRKDS
ncbi:MAG: type VII secretion protein EssA [Heyndrickxia faecalis]|jgi:type VII secretion protein EssA|uniref:type VII secretion protein EssA n=1 Tax=Heyndrickxia TaxID=2837504 RepID=UPI0021B2DF53|nr:type VII secretion protein EssA [Heyndrickxia coagulans]UXC23449.1 type VII secretion protein EssA [Heyndrickxia coagulans]